MGDYFNFRIIKTSEGVEVIDRNLITPIAALTPCALIEYKRTENDLYFIDRQKAKQKRIADKQKRIARNPLWKLACMCGIV